MLAPGSRVCVFTRDQDRDPFTFRGMARAERWADTEPVTVWWRFAEPGTEAAEHAIAANRIGRPLPTSLPEGNTAA